MYLYFSVISLLSVLKRGYHQKSFIKLTVCITLDFCNTNKKSQSVASPAIKLKVFYHYRDDGGFGVGWLTNEPLFAMVRNFRVQILSMKARDAHFTRTKLQFLIYHLSGKSGFSRRS